MKTQIHHEIETLLTQAFSPVALNVINESHEHAGHRYGAESSHFAVTIISPAFEGKTPVQCHRLVYTALKSAIEGGVHALKINAKSNLEGPLNG